MLWKKWLPEARGCSAKRKMGSYTAGLWVSAPEASQAKEKAPGKTVRREEHLGVARVQCEVRVARLHTDENFLL